MNEQDMQIIADKQIKELKEQGYKSFEQRDRHRQFQRATQDYERHLNCPYG